MPFPRTFSQTSFASFAERPYSSGEAKNERLKNVSDANLYIDIKAATDEEMQAYKNQQNEIKIDGYSFKLYVVKNGVNQEAYNSGSLSAGREGKVIINKF